MSVPLQVLRDDGSQELQGSRFFYSSHTQLYRIISVVKCKSGQVRSMDSAKYVTTQENINKYRLKKK